MIAAGGAHSARCWLVDHAGSPRPEIQTLQKE